MNVDVICNYYQLLLDLQVYINNMFVFAVQNSLTMEASLSAAQESYKRARNDFAAGLCEEQQKLLRQV